MYEFSATESEPLDAYLHDQLIAICAQISPGQLLQFFQNKFQFIQQNAPPVFNTKSFLQSSANVSNNTSPHLDMEKLSESLFFQSICALYTLPQNAPFGFNAPSFLHSSPNYYKNIATDLLEITDLDLERLSEPIFSQPICYSSELQQYEPQSINPQFFDNDTYASFMDVTLASEEPKQEHDHFLAN